jgi:hypothetical protein
MVFGIPDTTSTAGIAGGDSIGRLMQSWGKRAVCNDELRGMFHQLYARNVTTCEFLRI